VGGDNLIPQGTRDFTAAMLPIQQAQPVMRRLSV
jgi:hypothetical protein